MYPHVTQFATRRRQIADQVRLLRERAQMHASPMPEPDGARGARVQGHRLLYVDARHTPCADAQ
jgi:hypothetical protein